MGKQEKEINSFSNRNYTYYLSRWTCFLSNKSFNENNDL